MRMEKKLKVLGCFESMIEVNKKYDVAMFYVVQSDLNALLLETALKLGVVKIINSIEKKFMDNLPLNLLNIIQKCFEGTGKLKGVEVNLTVNENIQPVPNKRRRVPYHQRQKVELECDRFLKADVIEKVSEPTGWVSPIVITSKADGSVRMCVGMREPNKAI